jgi:predicted phage terminase large subunit-like protein
LENQWIPKRPHPLTGKSGPTKKQALFLCLLEQLEAFYGGAAGGGKSDALLMAAAMFFDIPKYSAIIFRKSFTDLAKPGALIDRSFQWFSGTKARWEAINHTWHFPSGAKLAFGYVENDMDVYHYQSAEFNYEAFDEVTHFTRFQYTYLISRARRLEGSFVPIRIRAAANPPGVIDGKIPGEWVKERFLPWFICPDCGCKEQTSNLGQRFCSKCGRGNGHVEFNEGRVFIPAKLDDNAYLDRKSYVESLKELDPVTREQLLNGNWSINPRGTMFQRGWFKIVDDYPRDALTARFWDRAATESTKGKDPDWTAGVKVAYKDGRYYIVDLVHFRGTPKTNEDTIKLTTEIDGLVIPVCMEQEPGSAGVDTIDHYARHVLPGYNFRGIHSTGPKELYASPLASAAEAGNVFLVRGPWNREFLDEFESFPQGPHDDIVDAASKCCHQLATASLPGIGVAVIKKKPVNRDDD